ncbi:structural maintenance of chromosomes protein 3-like [Cimex lectularius]|uniref:SMC hinge domain-containing protein n=1 Tax=Cimex lectularius TaxID=79782 RepID=A0A8I6SH06_CIMLE|nr:structural maintenance of chromosomes protein 3-like [Cimex lectularius]
MYIEKVEVQNFKSYRDKTVLDGLSPGLNVFIGQNGSGKSNLLQAVEFVLKGKKSFFRFHQKLHVLSDGCDGSVSVQIVLADCDPALGGRLALKREMNARGFDFFINNCKTSSKNFYRLLEICGFCTGAEYYFVNKNLLKTFITFSPEQKLDFLLSGLGMAFYKSVISIKEVLRKIENSMLRISSFQDHLSEISIFYKQSNAKELKKWKQFKLLCECKAYLMAQMQLNCLVKMRKKEIGIGGETGSYSKNKAEYRKNCLQLQKTTTLLEELKQMHLLTNTLLEDTEREILNLLVKQTQVELKINDLNEKRSILMKNSQKEISEDVVKELMHCLTSEEKTIKEETDMLNNLTKQLEMAENERALIIGKMGRLDQFPNKDSRDRWLDENIIILKNKINYEQDSINDFKKTILNLQELKEKYLNEMKVAELYSQNKNREEVQKRKYSLEYSSLQMEMNELQRDENILEYDIQNLQKSINFKKVELIKKVGRNIVEGIESVKKVIDLDKNENNGTNFQMAQGYLGTIIESFKCDDALNEAIDATVGKFMFSHIVTTDSIGTQILQKMKKLNLPGEAQFVPLNRIITRDAIQIINDDAMPLIKLLSFTDEVEKAMMFCFGGILICKNIEASVESARTYECTCVSIDGDVVKKSGILTGGYRQKKLSLRSMYNDILRQQSKISKKYQQLEYNAQKSNQLSQQMNKVLSELQKLNAKAKIENSQQSVAEVSNKVKLVTQEIESVKKVKERKEEEIKQLFRNLLNLELELKEPFGAQYTVDSSRLTRLNKNIIDRVSLNLETDEEEIWTAKRLIMNLFTSGDSILALANVQNFRICLMDEIDQFLTDETIDLLNHMLSELNNMQFFAASHRELFIKKGDNLFIVKNHQNRSFVNRIDENDTAELEKLLGTCSYSYVPEDSSISEY